MAQRLTYRDTDSKLVETRLRVFDFENPTENEFLCVRELWIRGPIYHRRADLVGFVNGIPLVFIECKNIHKDLRRAYDENLSDYRDTIPHVFHHNAIIVIGNGNKAKLGSVTSEYGHFHEWKRLSEDEPGVVDMETLLKGVLRKENLLDIFENFVLFDKSTGPTIKIVAHNHQYLGVNNALASLRDRKDREGKLGVFWHTQGSGKSYSMVFFTRKAHRKLGGNFTFLVCTDRDDLDWQIYNTFAGCGVVDNKRDPCRASSGHSLQSMLRQQKAFVFTLIQKFNESVDPSAGWTQRDDIVVLSDEAHRTQYGLLALNMRNALPNASYLGFTGTPLFNDDEITRRVFGDYVSTYDFQRAVDDGATVPLYYDARGEKLGIATPNLNVKIAEKLEQLEIEDIDVAQRLEAELKREYHIREYSSACDEISSDRVRTLPKMRTAQSGLTVRSLSHNIALWTGGDEVRPRWIPAGPYVEETSSINLLLVPWPTNVMPSQFSETEGLPSEMMNMAKKQFGFFTFEQRQKDRELLSLVEKLYEEATKVVGKVDGVILPEAAVTQSQHLELRAKILKKHSFLISGIGRPSEPGVRHGENYISIDLPPNVSFIQKKHHRWKLDESQIQQYGLGSRLDPGKVWWEHIDISQRELAFLSCSKRQNSVRKHICREEVTAWKKP